MHRILVVEDQEPLRELTRAILTKAGYDVAVAANGAEAVAAVRNGSFALVLMDLRMPVVDGMTATEQIRGLDGTRSTVPIIAFSGDGRSTLEAGMDDHIGKPIRSAALLTKVRAWLNRSGVALPPLPSASAQVKTQRMAFNEACELIGTPCAVRGLARLRIQIDATFAAEPDGAADHEQLACRAHDLAPLAALLGFTILSELCDTLEELCRGDQDVRLPFSRAKAAALRARKTATILIARNRAAQSR